MAQPIAQEREHRDAVQTGNPKEALDSIVRTYTSYVTDHASRQLGRFLFCGIHYRGFSHMLSPQPIHLPRAPPKFSHVIVRNFATSGELNLQEYDAVTGPLSYIDVRPPDSQSAQLVFVRGYPSREWISALGSQHRIDIEYFRQHLVFLEDKDYFDLPATPSHPQNILRLRIATLYTRHVPISTLEVQSLREKEGYAVWKYQRSLSSVGESIVRSISIHDEQRFSVEQDILVSLVRRKGRGWTGKSIPPSPTIIMMDTGRKFPQENLPWEKGSKAARSDCMHTVRRLPAKMMATLQEMTDIQDPEPDAAAGSLSHLSRQYGMLQQERLFAADPFYGISELFAVFLASETQLLNLVGRRADETMQSFKGREILALEDFEYSRRILDRHIQHIAELQYFIQHDLERGRWKVEKLSVEGQEVRAHLQDDFTHLARRAKHLLAQTSDGITYITNGMMLRESRVAIEKADSTNRLTLLAFFFLPLSFTTSLFGSNFKELGTGVLSIWTLFVVLVPVILLASLMCFWTTVAAYVQKDKIRLSQSKSLPRFRS